MEYLGLIALIYAVAASLYLYHHFTQIFEAQFAVTNKILAHVSDSEGLKPTLEEEPAPPMDWLYGVEYQLEEE